MRTRIITAVVALLFFVPVVILGGTSLTILISAIALVAMSEILLMRKRYLVTPEALFAGIGVLVVVMPASFFNILPSWFNRLNLIYIVVVLMLLLTVLSRNNFSFDDAAVLTISIFYIGFGFHYFLQARNSNYLALIFGLIIIWSTDIFAYVVGRKIGKRKLAPKISPNKTVEGSVVGTLIAVVIAVIYVVIANFHPNDYPIWMMALIAIVLSIAGQIGDLIESSLKRHYRIKDSGTILPGHGGILDRFDSMLIVLPIMAFMGVMQ